MQATQNLVGARGSSFFAQAVVGVKSDLIERKCHQLAHATVSYEEVLDAAVRCQDENGIKMILIECVESVQITYDRFIDELQKKVIFTRNSCHRKENASPKLLLETLQKSFDDVRALKDYSVAHYLIILEICEVLEKKVDFDCEYFLSEYVNTRRFAAECEDGIFGSLGQSAAIREDLVALFDEVHRLDTKSSLFHRLMAPMRRLRVVA